MTMLAVAVPGGRLVDAWLDGRPTWQPVAILLGLFVVAWTLFHIVSNASLDVHADLGEIYTWSRHPLPGYYKHPPLGALIGAAWFAVFPATDWSFRLLAMANAALGLFFVDLIARRYVSGEKRLFVLLLLLATPFYQFLGERFASNQTLLSTWPLATYCFLRSYESRRIGWSLAAGVAAALAMLGKYYSVYLVGALVVAAVWHPARWRYLASPAPWVAAAAGLAVMVPHLHWLATTGYQPFQYAKMVHGSSSGAVIAARAATYLTGGVAYVALPLAIYALVVRPSRALLRETLWPADPDRRMLVVLLAGMILLPPLSVPILGVRLTSLWTMSAWFLLPVILLQPAAAAVPRARLRLVALGIAAFTLACLALAPAVAFYFHATSGRLDRAYYRLIADELTRAWRERSGAPLGIGLGDLDTSMSLTFYLPGHPDSAPFAVLPLFPWVNEQRIASQGWVGVCLVTDQPCALALANRAAAAPRAHRFEADLTPRFFGRPGAARRYLLVVAPPASP